jgi:hypothetical protein
MWQRWTRVLERKGLTSWKHRGGVDVRMATLGTDNLAHYFNKLAREVTYSHMKESRGGRSPFKILTDGLQTGDADDLDLWAEWEQASYGRRQLTWSLGVHDLRKLADLGSEQSDEEVAEEDLQGEDVIALPHPTWEALLRGELTTDLWMLRRSQGLRVPVPSCILLSNTDLALATAMDNRGARLKVELTRSRISTTSFLSTVPRRCRF